MGWPLKEKDVKRYPHFDAFVPLAELQKLATNPQAVATHAFLPFLHYDKSWQPFRQPETPLKKKIRPIRYASRCDSAIYSYYRHILSQLYETELIKLGIQSCPIAYRKLVRPDGTGGMCNVDFAAQAFRDIKEIGSCCAVTLDISSYFDSIDHAHLRATWARLIGKRDLEADHAAVFRAITKYSFVSRDEVYERLGFIGEKTNKYGKTHKGFLKTYRDMPIQLCSMSEFREKVCGKNGLYESLVKPNKSTFGIPQGAPISDLLANIYLIDFDVDIKKYVSNLGGSYYRYSDDIFILVPGGPIEGRDAESYVIAKIKEFGSKLKIKDSKTAIVSFTPSIDGLLCATRIDRPGSRGGLEYLGFRFDGKKTYIRESTMSKFHRGIVHAARHRAHQLVKRYLGKDFDFLIDKFNVNEFEMKFGRVANFERSLSRHRWTFRTYIKRCAKVFGDVDNAFFKQTRSHRAFIHQTASKEISSAIKKLSTLC